MIKNNKNISLELKKRQRDMFQPVIKWSGSKRSQSYDLIKYFPPNIETYYEPLCGGASVCRALIESKEHKVKHYVCSDLNQDLINLWNVVKNNPEEVAENYKALWTELNRSNDKGIKRDYFEFVRKRYNKERNPLDFMFIMRTTTNGMPRYNSKGEFNNSFHITRDGINPDRLRKIILEWSDLLNENNVEFRCCSYSDIKPEMDDFLYLDPPYANTKGMYFGKFDNQGFLDWLRSLPCGYAFSYDGQSGNVDHTEDVPNDLFDEHVYLRSGNSSFKRIKEVAKDAIVFESLYVKKKK